MRSMDLGSKGRQGEFPLRQSFGAGTLLVIGDGQAVQHFGTARGELESGSVVGYRGASIAALGVVVSESQIAGRRGGGLLEPGRGIIPASSPLPYTTRLTVKPNLVGTNMPAQLSG